MSGEGMVNNASREIAIKESKAALRHLDSVGRSLAAAFLVNMEARESMGVRVKRLAISKTLQLLSTQIGEYIEATKSVKP